MNRVTLALLLPILVLMPAAPASAQLPGAEHAATWPAGPWRAEYYDNPWLRGSPALVRDEVLVSHNWEQGSPDPQIPSDRFSARWTRPIQLESGLYRFSVTSDDGLRLYVDGRLILDRWWDRPAQNDVVYLTLMSGGHTIGVEYYENRGLAMVDVGWDSVAPESWTARYYNNPRLQGTPHTTRHDPAIDFDWGHGAPEPGMPRDGFSVRWIRTATFHEGTYRFVTTTDDGLRLWVNGKLLIDHWHDQPPTSHSATAHLIGAAPIVMDYYENGGIASARLTWARVDDRPPSPADVVVDDSHPGFVKGGAPGAWRAASGGHDGSLHWTRNNDRVRANYNWARWYPDLAPGQYEVFVHIPNRHATTTRARYWIAHRDGYTLREVDQSAHGGAWLSLGAYRFQGSRSDFVSLADVTFEPYLSRQLAFDAVKWVLH